MVASRYGGTAAAPLSSVVVVALLVVHAPMIAGDVPLKYLYGLHAAEEHSASLYEGCVDTRPAWADDPPHGDDDRNPDLVIIGAQKGGTTKLATDIVGAFNWHVTVGAMHFSATKYRNRTIAEEEQSAYLKWFETAPTWGKLVTEKSPQYLTTEWAPLRACEVTPAKTKFVLLVREPVARAYSGFYQGRPMFGHVVGAVGRRDPAGFHALAEVEVEVINTCNPFGTNNYAADDARVPLYITCCKTIAAKYGHTHWPCSIDAPDLGGRVKVDGVKLSGPDSNAALLYNGGIFGTSQNPASIRNGVYIKWIELWLKYIPRERLLIFKAIDFYQHEDEVLQDIRRFVDESSAECVALLPIASHAHDSPSCAGRNAKVCRKTVGCTWSEVASNDVRTIEDTANEGESSFFPKHIRHFHRREHPRTRRAYEILPTTIHHKGKNSATKHHPHMLNKTRDMLKEFYQPYNERLEDLLMHKLGW
jgi:hypothetical protein